MHPINVHFHRHLLKLMYLKFCYKQVNLYQHLHVLYLFFVIIQFDLCLHFHMTIVYFLSTGFKSNFNKWTYNFPDYNTSIGATSGHSIFINPNYSVNWSNMGISFDTRWFAIFIPANNRFIIWYWYQLVTWWRPFTTPNRTWMMFESRRNIPIIWWIIFIDIYCVIIWTWS